MKANFLYSIRLFLLGSSCLFATGVWAGSSASYNIVADTFDSGGVPVASSANYSLNGSSAGGVGALTQSTTYGSKSGYVGQLYEIVALTLSPQSTSIPEATTLQLGAQLVLDDSSNLALDPATVTWSIQSGPISQVSASGLVTAGNVYQDTTASIQGMAQSLTNSITLTIRNTGHDDFGTYASDGLDDAWQVQYFGLNNPQAAPNVMSDGSGLTNLFKYTAGLIPNNTASTFTVITQSVPGQPGQRGVVFSPTFPDRNYTVLSSTDLTHWSTLTGPFPGNGSPITVVDPSAAGPQKFYRVQIDKP